MTFLLFFLLYVMVFCVVMLAGMVALESDDGMSDSILWPLAMFWPLSFIGLVFFLLFRASGVLEADRKQKEKQRAERSSRI